MRVNWVMRCDRQTLAVAGHIAGVVAIATLALMARLPEATAQVDATAGNTVSSQSPGIVNDEAARCQALALNRFDLQPGADMAAERGKTPEDRKADMLACRIAVAADPTDPRLQAQLARAIEATIDVKLRTRPSNEADALLAARNHAVDLGYVPAMSELASDLLSGIGGKSFEPEKARDLIVAASDKGNAPAFLQSARLAMYGGLPDTSGDVIVDWLRTAADAGVSEAALQLATLYRYGRFVKQSAAEAETWYRRAHELLDTGALVAAAVMYGPFGTFNIIDPDRQAALVDELVGEMQRLADGGAVYDALGLAYRLARERLRPRDFETEFEWLQDAARKGDSRAARYAGNACRNGQGTEKNPAAAERWYERAIELGDTQAFDSLVSLFEGDTARQDRVRARQQAHYRAAFEMGEIAAARRLAEIAEGAESLDWLRKGAEAGDAVAMKLLGDAFRLGDGTAARNDQAIEWYRKSAVAGNAGAAFVLGKIHIGGHEGVPRVAADPGQAIEWFKRAAQDGWSPAAAELMERYWIGNGVKRDVAQAEIWINRMLSLEDRFYSRYKAFDALLSVFGPGSRQAEYDPDKHKGYVAAALREATARAWSGEAHAFNWLERFHGSGEAQPADPVSARQWKLVQDEAFGSGALKHLLRENGEADLSAGLARQLFMANLRQDRIYELRSLLGRLMTSRDWKKAGLPSALLNEMNGQLIEVLVAQFESGEASAARSIGDLYKEGMLVSKDHARALEWYMKASDAGDEWSAINAMEMILDGKLNAGSVKDAISILETRAKDIDGFTAARKLGEYYQKNGDAGTAKEWLMRAIDLDTHTDVFRDLVALTGGQGQGDYSFDRYVEIITRRSEENFQKYYMNSVGDAFFEARFGHRNPEKAYLWYRASCLHGNRSSCSDAVAAFREIRADAGGDVETLSLLEQDFSRTSDGLMEIANVATKSPELNIGKANLVRLYWKAFEQGNDRALDSLLSQAGDDDSFPHDVVRIVENARQEQAYQWRTRWELTGDSRSVRALARQAFAEGNNQQALVWLEQAADAGSSSAARELAGLFENGEKVPKDWTRAARYYIRAAELGDGRATENLLRMARAAARGGGDTSFRIENPEKFVALLRAQASDGDNSAQKSLVAVASEDIVTPRDSILAVDAIRRLSAGRDSTGSQISTTIAEYYLDSAEIDLRKDTPWEVTLGFRETLRLKALDLLERAGDDEAMVKAFMRLAERDSKNGWRGEAEYWWEKAADIGHAPAIEKLAGIYLNKRSDRYDPAKALPLLERAGTAEAYREIGGLHARNIGGNPASALKWFTKALIAGGNTRDLSNIDRLLKGQKIEPVDHSFAVASAAAWRGDAFRETVAGLSADARASACQRLLSSGGYYSGTIDGAFGPQSQRAAEEFLKSAKLNISPSETGSLLIELVRFYDPLEVKPAN